MTWVSNYIPPFYDDVIIYPCTIRKKEVQEIMPQLGPILRTSYYSDVIMSAIASQITSLPIVYSTVYSSVDQRKQKKLRVTVLFEGNSPVTGEFPVQRASNAEKVSIWWRHHVHRNSNLVEILFYSHSSCDEVIAIKFCKWHASCAVVPCAKFCSDMINYSEVTLKPIPHRIRITMEKSFGKLAPVLI